MPEKAIAERGLMDFILFAKSFLEIQQIQKSDLFVERERNTKKFIIISSYNETPAVAVDVTSSETFYGYNNEM